LFCSHCRSVNDEISDRCQMGMGDLGNTDKGPPEMARDDVYFAPWLCGSVTEITSCRLLWISAIQAEGSTRRRADTELIRVRALRRTGRRSSLPRGKCAIKCLGSRRGAVAQSWIDQMRCPCNGIETDLTSCLNSLLYPRRVTGGMEDSDNQPK
jgi:hypothetical protein